MSDEILSEQEWRERHSADAEHWSEWADRFPHGMVPSAAFVTLRADRDRLAARVAELEPVVVAAERVIKAWDGPCRDAIGGDLLAAINRLRVALDGERIWAGLHYDINRRPAWVDECDRAVLSVDARNHPGRDRWFFDPRPYTDAVLTVLRSAILGAPGG